MRRIDKYKHEYPNSKLIERESPIEVRYRRKIVSKLLAKRYNINDIFKYLKNYSPIINGEKKEGYFECTERTIRDDIKTIKLERNKWYREHVGDYVSNLSDTLVVLDELIKEIHSLNKHVRLDKNGKEETFPLSFHNKLEKIASLIDLEKFRASISGLLTNNKVNINGNVSITNNDVKIETMQERINKLSEYVNDKIIDVEKS